MTTTINASTSAGLVQTADTSGSLALQTANTTAVTIDTSQNVGVGATPPTSDLGKSITINTAGNSLWSSQANQTDLLANATYNGGWKFVSSSSNYANRISVGNTNGQYAWQTSSAAGTSGNAITFNQLMTLNTNGVLGLYGGSTTANGVGIAFPATQSSSSNANTLDDYEEGDWTPTIASGYTGVTYNSQGGWYTKIGRFVNISGRVQFSGTANNTNIQIGSLPFSQANVGNGAYGGGGIPYCTVAAIVGTSPYVGSSTVDFYTTGTGTQITSGAVNVTNGWISFVITIASAT